MRRSTGRHPQKNSKNARGREIIVVITARLWNGSCSIIRFLRVPARLRRGLSIKLRPCVYLGSKTGKLVESVHNHRILFAVDRIGTNRLNLEMRREPGPPLQPVSLPASIFTAINDTCDALKWQFLALQFCLQHHMAPISMLFALT